MQKLSAHNFCGSSCEKELLIPEYRSGALRIHVSFEDSSETILQNPFALFEQLFDGPERGEREYAQ